MIEEPTQELQEAAPRTTVPALLRFLLAAILVVIVNLTLPRLCFELLGDHVVVADAMFRWVGSLVLLGGYLVLSRVVDQVETDSWTYIGLPRSAKNAFRQLAVGIAWGAILIILAMVPLKLTGLEMHFGLTAHSALRLAITTVLLIGGALLEELMFRGYPFQRLIEGVGVTGAILILSFFFGAVHLSNPNAGGLLSWAFFNTLTVGILFAIAYLRTKALWLPIGLHFGWNFFLGVVFGLPVSGIRDFSVVMRSVAHGPKLVTGGAYGIEASLTGSAVIVLGIIAIAWVPPRLLGRGIPENAERGRSI